MGDDFVSIKGILGKIISGVAEDMIKEKLGIDCDILVHQIHLGVRPNGRIGLSIDVDAEMSQNDLVKGVKLLKGGKK